mmetsp:Transcript_74604/g.112412  ORF Transcript_74604/g.112412 Transcript_74604/m.112412 type:complete len:194 (+) Transcript_74604:3-584(+)
MDSICVFCGSSSGNDPVYTQKANELGKEFVKRNIGLVYGGGTVGLMGEISNTINNGGGKVTGVIPSALCKREISGENIGEVIIVKDMHTRKALMAEKSQAFIAMPGGFGTFEELFEVITWAQLGIHKKPIGCLNVKGYYDPFVVMVDNAINSGFISESMRDLVIVESEPVALLDKIIAHKPPESKIVWEVPEI